MDFDAETGFIGPNGINVQMVGDNSIADLKNFVIGINQTDKHFVGANWSKDVDIPKNNS